MPIYIYVLFVIIFYNTSYEYWLFVFNYSIHDKNKYKKVINVCAQ